MLLEFITEHRNELIAHAREKVATRAFPSSTPAELEYGVPLFLTQLAALLRGSSISESALTATATKHGGEMLRSGFTIGQVVHDYGDVCECLTDLAVELGSPIATEEFRTLNHCLDEAIAVAVTEFLRLREHSLSEGEMGRFAALAHEQRNLISTAMVAFQVLRGGQVRISGRTGAVLGRALMGLRETSNRSLAAVRLSTGAQHRARIVLSNFIRDMEATAVLEATARGVHLTVGAVPSKVAVDADRLLLASAVSNLLSNAFKFSRPHGRVLLRTVAAADKIRIEVEDECGGLPAGFTEQLFRPFERRSTDRTGLGLGLAISRQGVQANGGTLDVRNLPGKGCIFSINLPVALEQDQRNPERRSADDRCDARPHHAAQLGRGGGDGEEGGGREAGRVREHPARAEIDLPLAGEDPGRERGAGAAQDAPAAVRALEGAHSRAAPVRRPGGDRHPGGAGAQGVSGLDRE